MTADQAAGFQSWHERLTATWHGMHRDLAQLEADRDRQLAGIQQQYQQLVTDVWHKFHGQAGKVMGDLWDSVDTQEAQAHAEPLPLPAPAPAALPDPVAPVLGDVRDHLAADPGPRPGPPWKDAPQPPAAGPPAAGSAANDSDRQP